MPIVLLKVNDSNEKFNRKWKMLLSLEIEHLSFHALSIHEYSVV